MTTTPSSCLPAWSRVLAVVAHPDDESFGLGAVLASFVAAGSQVSVLCLTRGEASTLHGVSGDLAEVRADELQAAASTLGITRVVLRDNPDGALAAVPVDLLVDEVASCADGVDGIVVFDPSGITGHPDHQRATEAAALYARSTAMPVLAWTLPAEIATVLNAETGAGFIGHTTDQIDLVIDVDRTTQAEAVACHPSQALPGSVLWRRLELLGHREHLRWIHQPEPTTKTTHASGTPLEKRKAR